MRYYDFEVIIMTFGQVINEYLSTYNASAKTLSSKCGVSASTFSRLRNTNDLIHMSDEQLLSFSKGIEAISGGEVKAADAELRLRATQNFSGEGVKIIPENLNMLISFLDINVSELAKALNFDASYLSRIRNGQRKPADPASFAEGVSRFAVKKCSDEGVKNQVYELIGAKSDNLQNDIEAWLCLGEVRKSDHIGSFLNTLNEFNLDEYIESIRFNDIKVPTLPFNVQTSKAYFGIKEMRRGELDFFKSAILSKSKDSVFMYSEMPMADMAEDMNFNKKWMMSVAMLLKKGVHINIIHNLDRPWDEIMLGLEAWIPIYMTGLVSPYYLKGANKGVFRHLNYVSGTAALSGECVEGKHSEGRYYLTRSREEVSHFRTLSNSLLAKASPLMEIYTAQNEEKFFDFLNSENGNYEEKSADAFKNIKINVCEGKWVSVSKDNFPHIHFLIFHPKLVDGIASFSAPINE